MSLLDLGREAQAEPLWNRALKAEPHHLESTYNQTLYQWSQGRLADDEAVARLEEARRTHARAARAPHLSGKLLLALGDHERAQRLLDEATSAGYLTGESEREALSVLTTTSCLLNKNRNPHLSKADVERYLCDYYGQQHVVWLGDGIEGDDTDGHVDDLARFVDARTIVVGIEDDPRDGNYTVLQDARPRLARARDEQGLPFTIVALPMPKPVIWRGQRLPATYMNFYFVNGAVLEPTFGQPSRDRRALEALQAVVPRRRVLGVDCRALIWGLGAIHGLTQQQPHW